MPARPCGPAHEPPRFFIPIKPQRAFLDHGKITT
jgi:hypothetical protein